MRTELRSKGVEIYDKEKLWRTNDGRRGKPRPPSLRNHPPLGNNCLPSTPARLRPEPPRCKEVQRITAIRRNRNKREAGA